MEALLFWPGIVLDALGILASGVAVIVHATMWYHIVATLKISKDAEFVIPAAKFKRWARVNAGMALIVGLNMVRWFVLNDLAKIHGLPSQATGTFDDFTWAVCDLLLVVMPIILVGNMHAMMREKDNARG